MDIILSLFTPMWQEGEAYTLSVYPISGNAVMGEGAGITYAYAIYSDTGDFRTNDLSKPAFEEYHHTGKALAKSSKNSKFALSVWRIGTKFDNYKIRIQLSKGGKKPYTPYIPDLTKVKVKRYGKNLLDIPDIISTGNGAIYNFECLFNFPVTISYKTSKDFSVYKPIWRIRVDHKDGKNEFITDSEVSDNIATKRFVGTPQNPIVQIVTRETYMQSGKCYDIQTEMSDIHTEYELYRCATFTPSPEGTVSGMTSLSPNMTILTDTPGVTIEATYNQDTNKVVGKLLSRISALEKAQIKM